MSAGNVLGPVGIAVRFCLWAWQLFELGAGLVPAPCESVEWASWLPGFSGQAY